MLSAVLLEFGFQDQFTDPASDWFRDRCLGQRAEMTHLLPGETPGPLWVQRPLSTLRRGSPRLPPSFS